jgi:hypothetical protein
VVFRGGVWRGGVWGWGTVGRAVANPRRLERYPEVYLQVSGAGIGRGRGLSSAGLNTPPPARAAPPQKTPQFAGSREATLLEACADALAQCDEKAFATAVSEFDSLTRLDAWKARPMGARACAPRVLVQPARARPRALCPPRAARVPRPPARPRPLPPPCPPDQHAAEGEAAPPGARVGGGARRGERRGGALRGGPRAAFAGQAAPGRFRGQAAGAFWGAGGAGRRWRAAGRRLSSGGQTAPSQLWRAAPQQLFSGHAPGREPFCLPPFGPPATGHPPHTHLRNRPTTQRAAPHTCVFPPAVFRRSFRLHGPPSPVYLSYPIRSPRRPRRARGAR